MKQGIKKHKNLMPTHEDNEKELNTANYCRWHVLNATRDSYAGLL